MDPCSTKGRKPLRQRQLERSEFVPVMATLPPCSKRLRSSDTIDGPADVPPRSGAWRRWISIALVISLVALFAAFPLMLTLLVLVGCNAVMFLVLACCRQAVPAKLALLTVVLMTASLFLTDWGFSSLHPQIRPSWLSLVPACISQLALVSSPMWLSTKRSCTV